MTRFLFMTLVVFAVIRPADAQNLGMLRTGGNVVAADLGQIVGIVWNEPDGEVDDTNADYTRTLQAQLGPASGTNISTTSASANVATNSFTFAASVSASGMSIAEAESTATGGGIAVGGNNEFSGSNSLASINLEVLPDPLDPTIVSGVLESTLSVIATPTENGVTGVWFRSNLTAGNFQIQYQDNNGTSTGTVSYLGEVIHTFSGGSGVNIIFRTQEPVAVGGTFLLETRGVAQTGAQATNISASSAIGSLSTLGSCTVIAVEANDPPPPAAIFIKIGDDEEYAVQVPDENEEG